MPKVGAAVMAVGEVAAAPVAPSVVVAAALIAAVGLGADSGADMACGQKTQPNNN
jgi:hypothetical protein